MPPPPLLTSIKLLHFSTMTSVFRRPTVLRPPCPGQLLQGAHLKIQSFHSIWSKVHYLDSTPLLCPLYRTAERYIAKFDFQGNVSSHSFIDIFISHVFMQNCWGLYLSSKLLYMQCLCDQSLFMRHQDPDDLPFKAGEELMVVSKVRIVTLVTILDYILSPIARGAMWE